MTRYDIPVAAVDLPGLSDDLQLIEQELRRILDCERQSNGPLVFECMKYAASGGKRGIRPLLGLQIARAFGETPATGLPYLLAVELLHTASLIVDDLPCMDNATVRRSRASAHLRFGEGIAILTAFLRSLS